MFTRKGAFFEWTHDISSSIKPNFKMPVTLGGAPERRDRDTAVFLHYDVIVITS